MAIFQKSVVEKFLSELEESVIDSAYSRFKEVYSVSRISEIKTLKEEVEVAAAQNDWAIKQRHDTFHVEPVWKTRRQFQGTDLLPVLDPIFNIPGHIMARHNDMGWDGSFFTPAMSALDNMRLLQPAATPAEETSAASSSAAASAEGAANIQACRLGSL